MIVRAVRIRTSPRGRELSEAKALHIGSEYPVLEIQCGTREKHGPILFRILDDEGDQTLWPSDCFVLVDGTIPDSWAAEIWSTGTLCLAPKRWQRPGFWDEVWYGVPGNEAERAYVEELETIRIASSPAGEQERGDAHTG